MKIVRTDYAHLLLHLHQPLPENVPYLQARRYDLPTRSGAGVIERCSLRCCSARHGRRTGPYFSVGVPISRE